MLPMTRDEMVEAKGGGVCGATGALSTLFCAGAFASGIGALMFGPSCAGLLFALVMEC